MSLTECSECKNKISYRAKTCPNCGHPQQMGCFAAMAFLAAFIYLGVQVMKFFGA